MFKNNNYTITARHYGICAWGICKWHFVWCNSCVKEMFAFEEGENPKTILRLRTYNSTTFVICKYFSWKIWHLLITFRWSNLVRFKYNSFAEHSDVFSSVNRQHVLTYAVAWPYVLMRCIMKLFNFTINLSTENRIADNFFFVFSWLQEQRHAFPNQNQDLRFLHLCPPP